jgi:NADH-quinone oxidoreductase subunit L
VLEHAGGHGGQTDGPEDAAAHGAHVHNEGPWSMLLPVGALAVLTAIGGLLNVPGAWSTFERWIAGTAEPLVEASVGQDYLTSLVAVLLGGAGSYLAWRAFRSGRELVPEAWRLHAPLAHKLYFDELYDALLVRPAQLLAVRLRDRVEAPVVQGSLDEIGNRTREAASEVARVQTGLLRTYAVAITGSVVVLAIVFLTVR